MALTIIYRSKRHMQVDKQILTLYLIPTPILDTKLCGI